MERDAAQGRSRRSPRLTAPPAGPGPAGAGRPPRWTGARGEWYVVTQIVLQVLVFVGPRTLGGWPAWPFPAGGAVRTAGLVLLAAGALLFGSSFPHLWTGRALTPFPYPLPGGALVQTGPYALVRHPIYAGAILIAFGWALAVRGWLTLGYAAALFLLFDVKARREERWLAERFEGYPAYRRRVRKLIPFVY